MATLVLQVAGGAVGGLFGPVGAAVGAAAGVLAGYYVDQSLFSTTVDRTIEGPRLDGARPMTAEEGTPVPRVYGHARVSTTVIWATRFEEETRTETRSRGGGGKGAAEVTETIITYHYYGNFAVALGEGPIGMVKRIWADGRELDLSEITFRVHDGGESQSVDPLIAAKQGAGNAPAYRGIAYIVFDRLPLESFGNRVPQIQVEVVRPVGQLERDIRAVTVIPGATEHGYSPTPVTALIGRGNTVELTRHILHDANDWSASIDELQALCPNLTHVSLVVAWFGTDLRAGACEIRPGVTEPHIGQESTSWQVAGLARGDAEVRLVSRVDDRPAYGGTPSDASVIAAIADLKARGLKVTLHPFIMMDVPQANALPDPYGGASQLAYPWRGRITCHPAIGEPGTADRTGAAASQIAAFLGQTQPGDLTVSGQSVIGGAGADWRYRRFVLHLARLAQMAGGVDAMLIGSELRGLTWLRDGADQFAFVAGLKTLAADVRAIVGVGTKLTYGADWSEYFGYHPQDGSGDVFFHLDALWSDANIDAVGIDNYMPLSDWRDGDALSDAGNPDAMATHDDSAAMEAQIAAGEGFDWYYASYQDRLDRVRTPITDGAHGKPWVYRYKDLVAWWSNDHYERIGGIEMAQPTGWVPRSKPFWFTELGCAAIHAGANQPNVFTDPKSAESAWPHQSNGSRSDANQRAFLAAHHRYWAATGTEQNPLAPDMVTPMVDPERIYLWAWDARPFPAFPRDGGVWSDGDNWLVGHWLNGRLGTAPLAETIATIFSEHDLPAPDVRAIADVAQGLVIETPRSARAILEPLMRAFGLNAVDTGAPAGSGLRLDGPVYAPITLPAARICRLDGPGDRAFVTGQADELPGEVIVRYRDAVADYIAASARSRRVAHDTARLVDLNLPCTLHADGAAHLADRLIDRLWAGRDRARCQVPLRFAGIEPGDVVVFDDAPSRHWRVEAVEITDRLQLAMISVARALPNRRRPVLPGRAHLDSAEGQFGGPPEAVFLDLPLIDAEAPRRNARLAVFAVPERAQAVLASPGGDGFEQRQIVPSNAVMGDLLDPLLPGPSGRYDRAGALRVQLYGGALATVSEALLLGGRNVLAIVKPSGLIELVQFAQAEELSADQWRLTGLLRGQLGTEDAAAETAPVGARAVAIDAHVRPAGLLAGEIGLDMNWRVGPRGRAFSERYFASFPARGGERALTPLSPVHLKARRTEDDGIALSWIRRTRLDGDAWTGPDVPLGEEFERYVLDLLAADQSLLASVETTTPAHIVDPAAVSALYGAMPAQIGLRVAQISARMGSGIAATATLPVL
ncbi:MULTISPECIES: glycoside hydrolase/phage tail family protein [unclassified Roseitalea]|uniref:baseplate multidomain protein megatron n=1 Tax=unclassified Roseitalea TaxID=2639107 RepID=UPI002740058F|nr:MULTISPECIES: glycoside hydrolase/phage tail family protein [unclassified Roseitalea]